MVYLLITRIQKFIIILPLLSLIVVTITLINPVTSQGANTDVVLNSVGVFPRTDTNSRLGWLDVPNGNGAEGDHSFGLPSWQIPNPRLDNSNSIVSRDAAFMQRRRQRCSNKFQIPHGRRRILEEGSLVRFRCNNGYILFGATVAACVDGKWSEPTPTCIAGGCRRPPISTGITGRALFAGAAIVFECGPGFRMLGEGVLVCNGIRWNGTAPSCQRLTPPTTTTTTPLPTPSTTASHSTEHEGSSESDENLGEDPNWRRNTWWSNAITSEPATETEAVHSTNPYEYERTTIQRKLHSDSEVTAPANTRRSSETVSSIPADTVNVNPEHSVAKNTPTSYTTIAISAPISTQTTTTFPDIEVDVDSLEDISNVATQIPNAGTTTVTLTNNNPVTKSTFSMAKPTSPELSPLTISSSTLNSISAKPLLTTTHPTTVKSSSSRSMVTITVRNPSRWNVVRNSTITLTPTTPISRSNDSTNSGVIIGGGNTRTVTTYQSFTLSPKLPTFPFISIPTRASTRAPNKLRCYLISNINRRNQCLNSFRSPNSTIPIVRIYPSKTYNLTANNTFLYPWSFPKNRSSLYSRNITSLFLTTTTRRTTLSPDKANNNGLNATVATATVTATPFSATKETTTTTTAPTTTTPIMSHSHTNSTISTASTGKRLPEDEFDNSIDQILEHNKEKDRINEIEKEKERSKKEKAHDEPKHELITPFKLDVSGGSHDEGSERSQNGSGSSFFLTLGSIVSVGALGFLVGIIVYYCWRKNKGIARSRRDSDGQNLPVHLDVEQEFVYFDNNRW